MVVLHVSPGVGWAHTSAPWLPRSLLVQACVAVCCQCHEQHQRDGEPCNTTVYHDMSQSSLKTQPCCELNMRHCLCPSCEVHPGHDSLLPVPAHKQMHRHRQASPGEFLQHLPHNPGTHAVTKQGVGARPAGGAVGSRGSMSQRLARPQETLAIPSNQT